MDIAASARARLARDGVHRKALWLALPAAMAAAGAHAAVTRVVTTCADSLALPDCGNNNDMTLRKAMFCAQNRDKVDLTQLQCSRITLAASVVAGPVTLTLNGPGRDKLTLDAGGRSRAIIHNGVYANTLYVNDLRLENGSYDNPYAYSNGGGCLYSSSSVVLARVDVANCTTSARFTAATGGAIFARTTATLTDSSVTGSSANDFGGHGAYGGGIAAGRMSLLRSTISGNSVSSGFGPALGGGVQGYAVGADSSTLSGNTAKVGGGVACQMLDLRNSTLSGNQTFAGGLIAGAYARISASVANSTIAGNVAGASTFAAGLYVRMAAYGTTFLSSTIVANNTAAGAALDFGTPPGRQILGGNDLVMAAQSGVVLPAGTLRDDPRLGPLRANGGPTATQALLPGSPAIDRGAAGNAVFDQRGQPRVAGRAADVGAYELADELFGSGFEAIR
jgi:hypothetical protein